MNILRLSPASPFGRKCAIAAQYLGLMDRIKVADGDGDPGDEVRKRNPLNKIPVMLTDDGQAIFDSAIIMDYLDHLAGGGKIIPQLPALRFPVLTMQALADGLLDSAVLLVYEKNWRDPEHHSLKWTTHQQAKIDKALAHLESNLPSNAVDAGTIAVASALGYLDLRFKSEWRATHPKLVAWLANFAAAVPAFGATHIDP